MTNRQWWRALTLQCQPWRWVRGKDTQKLRDQLETHTEQNATLWHSGRTGLLALLQAMELQTSEEVIVPAYTCAVVPNAVAAAGGHAVFVDIDPETLNLDPQHVKAAITPHTRAVLCQHTFGLVADTAALRQLCDEHGLLLIEDCAHVLPADMEHGAIGQHADAIMLSFGRDKAISGVSGGAILTRDANLHDRLQVMEAEANVPSWWETYRLLCYPLFYRLAHWLRPWPLAKLYLKALQVLRLLIPVLQPEEKRGHADLHLYSIANGCAALALVQFKELAVINQHRQTITALYTQAAQDQAWSTLGSTNTAEALQKYPLLWQDADTVRQALKQQHIYLDDGWCGAVINPRSVNPAAVGYAKGSCPQAEKIAQEVLCLPTHPGMSEGQALTLITALIQMNDVTTKQCSNVAM